MEIKLKIKRRPATNDRTVSFRDPLLKKLEEACAKEGEVDFEYWLRRTLAEVME